MVLPFRTLRFHGAPCGLARALRALRALPAVRVSLVRDTRWRCCLAPGLAPLMSPALCLSSLPRGSAFVCRATSGPVAPASLASNRLAVPSPTGCFAPQFLLSSCAGHAEAGPVAGSWCLLPPPPRGGSAGHALRRTRWGPRCGVVPAKCLRRWSRAACTVAVLRVWTRSLRRPVSPTIRLWTWLSAEALGLLPVDPNTSPCGWEDATPGSVCVCMCVCSPVRAS